ncbi:competence protein ComFC [Geomicrobium halophilum]|uniref:Competence protein ComFC n=1 Tax=Geomicrobium halophilum TaxID=549000 RepID=A0A841Q032_9BACL|nr:ComF family protein [Geomicrobium halophilum]MBB6450375.1 competence protein ComFC [Geomicrobium halophilum]
MKQNYCLRCLEPLEGAQASWTALLSCEKKNLCESCSDKFHRLAPPWCLHCARPLSCTESCGDCERWAKTRHWSGLLTRNISLFSYNDFLQELISTYKYRGDIALAEVFKEPLRNFYQQYFTGTTPVPVPLSKERLQERGFNQAEVIAEFLPVSYKPLLVRDIHEKKQSKGSRQDRLRGHVRPFVFNNHTGPLTGQHILLIDDIYTTGTTLRKAALPLLENGAGRVSSLTIARS